MTQTLDPRFVQKRVGLETSLIGKTGACSGEATAGQIDQARHRVVCPIDFQQTAPSS